MTTWAVSVKTPKGWHEISIHLTTEDADNWINRIIAGTVKLKYEHELIFKVDQHP